MSIIDLALTKGMGNPFDILTLERIAKQNLLFSKPRVDIGKMQFITLIPLAIIAFLVLKKLSEGIIQGGIATAMTPFTSGLIPNFNQEVKEVAQELNPLVKGVMW